MNDWREDCDWQHAFEYAGPPESDEYGGFPYGHPNITVAPGANASAAPFQPKDVAEVIGMREGENDGPSWLMAGRLNDGRWFFLEAGCDYTGWDCMASGSATVADTRERLLTLGMTGDDRAALGLA